MAEGNGEIIEEMATTNKTDGSGEPERTADYPKLVEYGLDKRVNFIHPFQTSYVLFCAMALNSISRTFLSFACSLGGSQIR